MVYEKEYVHGFARSTQATSNQKKQITVHKGIYYSLFLHCSYMEAFLLAKETSTMNSERMQ
jgi:hypothetical protein